MLKIEQKEQNTCHRGCDSDRHRHNSNNFAQKVWVYGGLNGGCYVSMTAIKCCWLHFTARRLWLLICVLSLSLTLSIYYWLVNSSFFLQSHLIFANDEHSHHQTSEAIWRYKIARWKSWLESWNLLTMQ